MSVTTRILHGDCLDLLATLPAESIDALVTDPPYGIGFMGHRWDQPGKHQARRGDGNPERAGLADDKRRGNGAMTAGIYDFSVSANRGFQAWCEAWAREAVRVLKPGSHAVVCGSTRTYHRMASGLEDAGFEIRDCLAWLFGSGFPKSLNLGEGLGTALKPAHEPIVLARKPFKGTVAANVAKFGTGALNIDSARIRPDANGQMRGLSPASRLSGLDGASHTAAGHPTCSTCGTVPSRVDAHAECILSTLSSWAGCEPRGGHLFASGGACVDCLSIAQGFLVGCLSCRRSGDALIRHASACDLTRVPSPRDARVDTDRHGKEWSRIHASLCSDHRAIWDAFLGLEPYCNYIQRRHKTPYIPNQKNNVYGSGMGGGDWSDSPLGRWPANVALDEIAAMVLDEQSGELAGRVGMTQHASGTNSVYGKFQRTDDSTGNDGTADVGGASRFYYVAKPSREERDYGCEGLAARSGGECTDRQEGSAGLNNPRAGAGRTGRAASGGSRNFHPT